MGTGTGTGNFSFFLWYRNRYRKKWYRKKVSEPASEKFGTGKSIGTGIGKIWYRKKVPEPVSEKFGTGKRSRNRYRKNLVPELIFVAKFFEFRRIIMGTGAGTGNFSFFSGGIGKIWYCKKVSEPVSVKFGTGKSTGIGIENI